MLNFVNVMPAKSKIYSRLTKFVCTPVHFTMHYMAVFIIALVITTLTSQASTSVVVANPLEINNVNVYSTNLVGIDKFSKLLLNKKYSNFVVEKFFTFETQMGFNQFANDLYTTSEKSQAVATDLIFAMFDNSKFSVVTNFNLEILSFVTQVLKDENLIDIWFKLDNISKEQNQINYRASAALLTLTNQQWVKRNPFNIKLL